MMKWRRIVAWGIIVSLVVCGLSTTLEVTGQTVVNQLENVKKPGMGKLYFSKRDSSLNIWKGKWVVVGFGSAQPPVVVPPVVVPPVVDPIVEEIALGYWEVPDRILVAKLLDGKYHLMQTNAARSYYVARGKNLLNDSRTKRPLAPNGGTNTSDGIIASIVSGNSDIGGLATPASFKDGVMTAKGYVKNNEGEWVFDRDAGHSDQTPVPQTPVPQTPVTQPPVVDPVADKIKIPVGAIMWDGWYRDYWNDANPKYDVLINHVSKSRLVATEWMEKFRVVPFYGQYHEPEKIKIRYNVRWSQELGRNVFDEMERDVRVRYDKTQADTDREIQYYAEAGFDFLCFNYYNSDSPLSEARLQFVNAHNKRGMKMTFMLASKRSDAEINYITDLMLREYWFRIDNKPVLYFNREDMLDLAKYKAAYAAKGGGDIYVVYYEMGGYPGDFGEYQKYRANAGSSYSLFIGQATADMLIKAEVNARNTWVGQYKNTQIGLIPVLTTGFENLHNRTSLDAVQGTFVEKATLPQIEQKLELLKVFIKEHPEKVPAVLWYAGNEILESGNPIVPTKRKDGSIDTSMLDTIKKHLE
jgi:hypothetical protein